MISFMNRILHLPTLLQGRQSHTVLGVHSPLYTITNHRRSFLTAAYQSVYSSLFAPGCVPVDCITQAMYWMHGTCHVPWWASVVLTSVVLRSVLILPFSVYQTVRAHKLSEHLDGEEQRQAARRIKNETMLKALEDSWDKKKYKTQLRSKKAFLLKEQTAKYPLHGLRFFFLQAPLWLSFSFSVRNMCGFRGPFESANPVPGLSTGGWGTFSNLLESDPTLSVILLLFNIINFQIISAHAPKLWRRILLSIYFTASGSICLVSLFVPAALPLFWCVSSGHQMLMHLAMMSPRILRTLNIPPTSQTPYRDLIHATTSRYRLAKLFSRKK